MKELTKDEIRDIKRFNKDFVITEESADGKEMRGIIVLSHGSRKLHDSGYPFIKIIGEGKDGKFYWLGVHDHFISYAPTNTDSYGKNLFHVFPWSDNRPWVVRGRTWTSTFQIGSHKESYEVVLE